MIVICKRCRKKYNRNDIGGYGTPNLCPKCKKNKSYLTPLLMVIALCILLIPLASAEIQTLGTFKQADCVNLKQVCSNCSYVNITSVLYPNSTQVLGQVIMTKVGTDYNYTICTTDAIGQYIVNGKGDLNGNVAVWSYDFEISATGTELTIGQSILYGLGFVLMILMFGGLLFGAFKIKWKHGYDDNGRVMSINHLKYFKIVCIVLSYVMLLLIFAFAESITNNLLAFNGIHNAFNWVYWILLYCMYPLIVISFIIALMVFVDNYVLKKKVKRRFYR